MSSGYDIRPNFCWLPANWVARAVADSISAQLVGNTAEVLRFRTMEPHLYPGAMGSFVDASAEELRAFCEAARLGRSHAEQEGPLGWSSPEMFPGFLRAFDALLAGLASDPRLVHPQSTRTA